MTLAWTLFFAGTALVSTLLFALASLVAWSTFANYVALPLVAAMFVAKYACRRFALSGMRQSSLLDAVRALPAVDADEAERRAVTATSSGASGSSSLPATMSSFPLFFHASLDQTLAWRDGAPVSVHAFLADVKRVAAALPAGGHVYNVCANRYRFTVSLCATLVAGKTSLLPSTHTPEMVRALASFAPDAFCLHDSANCAIDLPRFRYPEADGAPDAHADAVPQIDGARVVAYVFTSGSTGTPVSHRKTWAFSCATCAPPRASVCSTRRPRR